MAISLFTPLIFLSSKTSPYSHSYREKTLNRISKYFLVNKTKAFFVLPPKSTDKFFKRIGTFSSMSPSSTVITALKILSYVTLIIPLIMLVTKLILAYPYHFSLAKETTSKSLPQAPPTAIRNLPSQPLLDRKKASSHKKLRKPTQPFTQKFSKKSKEKATPKENVNSSILTKSPHVKPESKEDLSFYDLKTLIEKPSLKPLLLKMPLPLSSTPGQDPNQLPEQNIITHLENLTTDVISEYKEDSSIKYHSHKGKYLCFETSLFPSIIFKTHRHLQKPFQDRTSLELSKAKESTLQRLANMQLIEQHVKNNPQYSRLLLPKYKAFHLFNDKLIYIAEEKLPLVPDREASLLWRIKDIELREAFVQLTHLILKTGLGDITTPNCTPVFINNQWSLALIDLEVIAPSAKLQTIQNFIGWGLHSKESISTVIGLCPQEYQSQLKEVMNIRLQTLEKIFLHEQSHAHTHTNPYGKISLNFNAASLGLPLHETAPIGKTGIIDMKTAITSLQFELIQLLREKDDIDIIESHSVTLNFSNFSSKLTPPGLDKVGIMSPSGLWIHRILNALVEKKIICSWTSLTHTIPTHPLLIQVWI